MRTTVSLDDHLLAEAKELASRGGRTLSAVVEEALRESVLRSRRAAEGERDFELPVSELGGGTRPGVDLDSNASVREALDEGLAIERRRW